MSSGAVQDCQKKLVKQELNIMPNQNIQKTMWWQFSIAKAIETLQSDSAQGLNEQEVVKRLEIYGPNTLPEPPKVSVIKLFLHQFTSFIVLTLIGALIISALFGEWIDAA